MKDHEKQELISELAGIAHLAHDGGQILYDLIADALDGVFSAIDEATARAERAEAELKAAREQEPVARVTKHSEFGGGHHFNIHWLKPEAMKEGVELYAGAPAPDAQVPPAHPEGEVIGPCICGSWPGGKCLRCNAPAPAAQVPQEWRICLLALETLFSPLVSDSTQAVWMLKARALLQQEATGK